MMNQKRYMQADEILFVITDLRAIMTTIAGHIRIRLNRNEDPTELRQHITLIAGSIAEMNHKMKYVDDCKIKEECINYLNKRNGVGGAN